MITPDDIAKAFNEAGLDTPEKLFNHLKPSIVIAKVAHYDGQIAALEKLPDADKRKDEIDAIKAEKEIEVQKLMDAQGK